MCYDTSSSDDEEQADMIFLNVTVECHEIPFEEKFKIKDFWKDILILKK